MALDKSQNLFLLPEKWRYLYSLSQRVVLRVVYLKSQAQKKLSINSVYYNARFVSQNYISWRISPSFALPENSPTLNVTL